MNQIFNKMLSFTRKGGKVFVLKFGIIQSTSALLLWILLCFVVLWPIFINVKDYALEVVNNATFTQFTINNNELDIDIKPEIFVNTLKEDENSRLTVLISQTDVNPYYWDDRVKDSRFIKVEGIAFMKEGILVKVDDSIRRFTYNQVLTKNTLSMTKEGTIKSVESDFSQASFIKYVAISSFFIFISSYVLLSLFHAIYSYVTGFVVASLKLRLDKYFWKATHIASVVYIPFFSLVSLLCILKILFYTSLWVYIFVFLVTLISYIVSIYVVYRQFSVNFFTPDDKTKD